MDDGGNVVEEDDVCVSPGVKMLPEFMSISNNIGEATVDSADDGGSEVEYISLPPDHTPPSPLAYLLTGPGYIWSYI